MAGEVVDESPKNKVKFLCSHGGKVLPRPSDGLLKYVGGETRVISVPRDITFSELMKKVNGMMDGDVVLKYQLIPEDLDTLVSVKTDEDLKHMMDEHDRHGTGEGSPLLRTFLFQSKPVVVESHTPPSSEPSHMLELRYIDAINGIIRTSPKSGRLTPRLTPIRPSTTTTCCSACSSPKSNSPDGGQTRVDSAYESPFHPATASTLSPSPSPSPGGGGGGQLRMQRVRSSPSISSLSTLQAPTLNNAAAQQQGNNTTTTNNGHYHQHPQHYLQQGGGYPPQIGIGMGRPPPFVSSLGKISDKFSNGFNSYYPQTRPPKACALGYYYDDSPGYGYAHVMPERVNLPRSPRKSIWE